MKVLEAVAAVAAIIYAPEIALFVAGSAATAATVATVATAISSIGLMVGSSILGSALQQHALRNQRDAYNAGLQSRTVTRIATDAPLRFVYGRARVGSEIVAMFTSGANDEFRHLVCVHAAHECDAIEEIYINGEALGALDGSGNVTTGIYASSSATSVVTESHSSGSSFTVAQTPIWTPTNHSVTVVTGSGANMTNVPVLNVVGSVVTTGLATNTPCVVTYQVNSGGTPRVRVQKHLGGASDAADATLMNDLAAGVWPSTSVLRGFCYTVIRLDLNQPTFQNGMPAIEVRLRGKKLYDPRTGTTAWSSNPALAIWDYLLSPLCGVKSTDLPTVGFIAAANVCDDTSTVPAGRYTFNGTVTSDQDQARTLDAMARSMAGTLVATTWAIQAGSYVAPIMALVQADIVGELSITPGISGASIYNGVKGQFIDVNNNYAVTDFVPFQNSAYRTADGIDYFANVDYPFTNTIQAVNNLASIYLADQRNSFTIVADFSLKAWPLQIGDRVTLTSSFIGQTTAIYRVTDKKYSPTSTITLTLKQDDPSIWAYSSTTVQPLAPASNLANPWTILPLAAITCTSGESALLLQPDGTIIPRILVSWPIAPTQAVKTNGQIEIQWQAVGSTAWQSMQVNGSDTQAYITGVTGGAIYIIRARCINPYMTTKSDWIIATYQVTINSGVANVYQWAASVPASPTGMASYTWSNNSFGAAPTGWSLSIPTSPTSGGVTLWIASISVVDITGTGSTSFDWSKSSVLPAGYAPSTIGGSVTVFAYQRSAATPSGTPGNATYTFPTLTTPGAITTPSNGVLANGWTTYIPSGTNALWVTQALASAQTATFAITSAAWSSAAILAQNGSSTAPIFSTSYLYQWYPAQPAGPTGTSTYTWSTGATTASGSWSSTVPSNPGTPGLSLWTVMTQVTDVSTATSSLITWANGYTISSRSQNGTTGTSGIQSGAATVYQWAATIPAGPAGAATYTWSTATFGAAPSGWALTPGTSPSPGYTLWAAKVGVTDSASNSTTSFNWTSAAITAAGYAGTQGANGSTGSTGATGSAGATGATGSAGANGAAGSAGANGSSYVTAYCASSTVSTTTTPASTTGITSLPAANDGGISGTYQATVPSLASGQYLYQVDGIYSYSSNKVVWSIPYWSSLKVGSLSSITTNTGSLTVSGTISSANGAYSVDASGNLTATSASLRGAIMGGSFTSYNWPSSASATGFYLGPEGVMFGTTASGNYFNADKYGNVYAPNFSIVNGVATFGGTLSAASGTFGTITSGLLQNSSASNYINLTATGGNPFLVTNGGSGVVIKADGSMSMGSGMSMTSDGALSISALNIINTGNINTESVTIPRSVSRSDQIYGTSTGVSVIERNITLTQAGTIIVFCTCSQSTSGSSSTWNLTLDISGTVISKGGGQVADDSVALSGSLALSAGTYSVRLVQNSASGSSVTDRNITIFGAMR